MTGRMLGPAWHERQGYETCGCGRVSCRHRRRSERRRMRRIEAQQWRKEVATSV